MQYREHIVAASQSSDRRLYQYIGLFFFLVVTYAIYISIDLKAVHAGPDQADSLLNSLIKLCCFSALPFAFFAYADRDWCSNDAAPVCLAAWIAACVGFSFKCQLCALGMALAFFPFVVSALLAHGLGALCRFFKDRIG